MTTPAARDSAHAALLLARHDTGRPVLAAPVPVAVAAEGRHDPGAVLPPERAAHLDDSHASPDHLPAQRWGVIAPEGPVGDDLLARLAPLLKKRAEDQGRELLPPFRVPPAIDAAGAIRWVTERFNRIEKDDRPKYLLCLGDLAGVSVELQTALSVQNFTGRLAFTDPGGYDAYVTKVLAYEAPRAAPPDPASRAWTYTVRGSAATDDGFAGLIDPLGERSRLLRGRGRSRVAFEERSDLYEPSARELLEFARDAAPAVLLSLSHGAGAPSKGQWSPEERRRLQGAMCFGDGAELLTAEHIAAQPFLPGGIWFYFACYGAGTPRTSAFWHWLRSSSLAASFSDADLLGALPQGAEPGFLAALPQAALANPKGPLAVVGHLDLAWSFAYDGPASGGGSNLDRFLALTRLAERTGADPVRVGSVFGEFIKDLAPINQQLTDRDDREQRAQLAGAPAADDARERGRLWLLRQDLAAYMLLGDPAVYLPIAPPVAAREARVPSVTGATARVAEGPSIEEIERSILPVLAGEKSVEDLAEELGLGPDVVQARVDAYRDAGRAALRRL